MFSNWINTIRNKKDQDKKETRQKETRQKETRQAAHYESSNENYVMWYEGRIDSIEYYEK